MIGKNKLTYEQILADYTAVTISDDDRLLAAKQSLKMLTEAELKIFIAYLESNLNYSETAKQFNCSPPTVKSYIQRIQEKLCANISL